MHSKQFKNHKKLCCDLEGYIEFQYLSTQRVYIFSFENTKNKLPKIIKNLMTFVIEKIS